jgi:hypothetical protein
MPCFFLFWAGVRGTDGKGRRDVPPCRYERDYLRGAQFAVSSVPAAKQQLVVELVVLPTTPLESPPNERTPVVAAVIGDAS